jgi:hypothetical protein
MANKILHITNGNSTTNYLQELDIKGCFLTWQEMLCEGSTIQKIDSEAFFNTRKEFLNSTYSVDLVNYKFPEELKKLNYLENYSEIILWFEYDLFCHINMCAAISLLKEKNC